MRRSKDALPKDTQPGLIYAIGCKVCPEVYVGETQRTAKQRLKEHKGHARNGHDDLSAVAHHTINKNHAIHWETRVLAKERHPMRRKVREALTHPSPEEEGR